jgi:integrase/recombinase XerD
MTTSNRITPLRQRMIEDMSARNLRQATQRGHIYSCKLFAGFLKRSPDTATADDLRRFQLHLIEAGHSICNRNRIMTGVRFLFRVTLRRHDLAAEIFHLKEPQRLPLTMSRNEAERLLVMTGCLRDHILLSLGYGCGLRAGEIVRLKVGDIDSSQMIIRIVQSKGRKDRHVMLPEDLLASLREWWRVRPTRSDADVPVKERWLFPGRRKGEHLTYRQLSRVFHQTAAAAGITKRISLHSLRHSFATELLEEGTDIRYIQAVLGHDKLDTTARYTRVATSRIAAIDSPLKHLGSSAKPRKLKTKQRKPKTT